MHAEFLTLLVFAAILVFALVRSRRRGRVFDFGKDEPNLERLNISTLDPEFLSRNVLFFKKLAEPERIRFRQEMAFFLQCTRITGVDVVLSKEDIQLVAASAVIPIFYFQNWHRYPLDEVLVYSSAINPDFETDAPDSLILGMVGTGHMEGKMALSRLALWDGFSNKTDKHNTALHEFVHLLDKHDGVIDGLPKILLDKTYALPWLRLVRHKMDVIRRGHSDIPEYGGTNLGEFFAVSAEYFFERPDLLKIKHPELYEALDYLFRKMPADEGKTDDPSNS
jgi:MtfA peptidase